MRKRLIKVTTVRAAKRFIAALVGMPSIAFIIAIIFPSQAYADNTQSDQGGAGQNTNVGSSASSEVVQEDPSVVSAQGTVTEASTAVATAESAVTTLETKVTQLTEVASSISQPAQVITTAVQSATNSVETASAATESAATAVSTAETAIATSQTANQTLAGHEDRATLFLPAQFTFRDTVRFCKVFEPLPGSARANCLSLIHELSPYRRGQRAALAVSLKRKMPTSDGGHFCFELLLF